MNCWRRQSQRLCVRLLQPQRQFSKSSVLRAKMKFSRPNSLLISCMDSRLVPSTYLNMDPGSTFIVRNPGNFVPDASLSEKMGSNYSAELAALELVFTMPDMKQIIIGGHSDCRALAGLRSYKQCCIPEAKLKGPLPEWILSCGEKTWYKYLTQQANTGHHVHFRRLGRNGEDIEANIDPEGQFCIQDKMSQINTLQQLENICSHKLFRDLLAKTKIQLNAIWYDVLEKRLFVFDWEELMFKEVDTGIIQILKKRQRKEL